jgi:hypothetical protein
MFFSTLDDVMSWLEQRSNKLGDSTASGQEDSVASTDDMGPKPSRFCRYFKNHNRCSRDPHPDPNHYLVRDDSLIFGEERRIVPEPVVKCHFWGGKHSEGQCELPGGHPGEHNYRVLYVTPAPSDLRCNVHSSISGSQCKYYQNHGAQHSYETPIARANSRDLVLSLPETRRPCKLSTGCNGTMAASLRKYKEADKPLLWWYCVTCNHHIAWKMGNVVKDPRVEASQKADADLEDALKELAGLDNVPSNLNGVYTTEDDAESRAEVDESELAETVVEVKQAPLPEDAGSELQAMGDHVRRIMEEDSE